MREKVEKEGRKSIENIEYMTKFLMKIYPSLISFLNKRLIFNCISIPN